ncbi:hypothetical protein HOY36_05395 [Enterococcus sp. MMGLQ5-2]|nr:hypothetical protein [Enterococcus sp. MMGLQ5-2]MBS7584380.1 hypothetical protein [Enterococcus sp. MMGLQ5-1]NPD12235.1 hypothetical protein [Enterococcus sp. MMGLQ5-1]NPD36807.1 hypothetical protein [Enterococcus sp. MMGLQ5-2]
MIYRIQRFQLNQLICQRFNCTKTDYSLRRFDDGYLVSIKDKEYRIKLSNTRKPKITFVKAIQRIKEVQK